MAAYDRSAKWIMEHYGKSLLWLGGETRKIVSCQTRQAEVVLPAKLPDGCFEVQLLNDSEPELHLLEVFVYPDSRALDQIVKDLELVHADRGILPELSVLSLRPLGRYRIPTQTTLTSRGGATRLHAEWRCRELWHVPAADLLAQNDPGLIPWVPLCRTRRSAKSLLAECRDRINQLAAPEAQDSLLATTYVYANLRFDDKSALKILGDRNVLIETPLIKELMDEGRIKGKIEGKIEDIISVMGFRFGAVSEELGLRLKQISDTDRLSELLRVAVTCKSTKAFERELPIA